MHLTLSVSRAAVAGAATLTFALLSPVGCSSTTNGNETPTTFTEASLEAACSRDYDAYVARAAKCTGANPNPSDTREASIRGCKDYAHLPGLAPTPAMFEACTKQEGTAACDEPLTACDWRGTLSKGAACNFGTQCASTYCKLGSHDFTGADGTVYSIEDACGVCADAVQQGGACDATNACASGLRCIDATCQPSRKKGETCRMTGTTGTTDARDCASPLRCSAGKCAPRILPGGACAQSRDCQFGSVCDSGTCVAATWGLPGASCDGFKSQCAEGWCDTVADAQGTQISGTCGNVLKDGETCSEDGMGPTCGSYSQCVKGVCTPYYAACH